MAGRYRSARKPPAGVHGGRPSSRRSLLMSSAGVGRSEAQRQSTAEYCGSGNGDDGVMTCRSDPWRRDRAAGICGMAAASEDLDERSMRFRRSTGMAAAGRGGRPAQPSPRRRFRPPPRAKRRAARGPWRCSPRAAISEEPVMADAVGALRQHMQQKAPDELVR